jgi:hypothetical protein
MKKLNILTISIILTLLVTSVYALTCNPSSITLSNKLGETPTSQTITCQNNENNSVSIYQSGTGSLFSVSQAMPIIIANNSNQTFILTFSQQNTVGNFSAFLYSSDGLNLPVNINIASASSSCDLDLFPLSMNNIKIQIGDKKSRSIQLSVPSCYTSDVKINAVTLATDEKPIQLGEINLGVVKPGSSIQIPIDLDANGISVGSYSDNLQILAYNDLGKKIDIPQVNINVMATAGINPITNFTFEQLPTCSIDSLVLNMNKTYKMTCSIPNPNIKVSPIVDRQFIKGSSVSETSNQIVYEFSGIKIGTTQVGAEFLYNNFPIGSSFMQEVKVTPNSGLNVGNVNLNIQFFQKGIKKTVDNLSIGESTVLIVDNQTGNLIPSYQMYVNGNLYPNSTLLLESEKIYELRFVVSGYIDLVLSNVSVNQLPLTFSLSPYKEIYRQGDYININSTVSNFTVLLNNIIMPNPFPINQIGNLTIQLVKEGYITQNITIQVKPVISLVSCSPLQAEWKKGSEVTCQISENTTWSVLRAGLLVTTGTGSTLSFDLNNIGAWSITSSDGTMTSFNVEDKGWLNFIITHWLWFGGGTIVLIGGLFYIKSKNSSSSMDYSG